MPNSIETSRPPFIRENFETFCLSRVPVPLAVFLSLMLISFSIPSLFACSPRTLRLVVAHAPPFSGSTGGCSQTLSRPPAEPFSHGTIYTQVHAKLYLDHLFFCRVRFFSNKSPSPLFLPQSPPSPKASSWKKKAPKSTHLFTRFSVRLESVFPL